ncbi:MAG: sensor histidine kinase [Actinomycetota bacterium]
MAGPQVTREEILLRAGLALATELSLPDVLQRIVELACEVSGARYGALGVIRENGTISDFLTHGITPEQRAAIGRLPQGKGLLGALIHDAKPLRLQEIASDPRSVGFPANHPPMKSFLGVPLRVRSTVFGNLYLTEKQGASEFTEDDQRAVETLAGQAAVAIENARLYEENRRARRRLEALNEVGAAILAGGEINQVLDLIARSARDLVGANAATIAVPTVDPGQLVIRVAVGESAEELRGMRYSATESLSGEAMRSTQPLVIKDVSLEPHLDQPVVRIGIFGPTMVLPLAVRGRAFGSLTIANIKGTQGFTDDDLDTVRTFADQASVALDYFRAQDELQRLALIEERERIAKDLHDDIIQSLFAEGMALQAAESMVDEPEAIRHRLSTAVDHIDRVIRDLRNYIFGLRPGVLADRQLHTALADLVESFAEGSSARFEIRTDPEIVSRLAGRANEIVQAAREAISNAVKHSEANEIVVLLEKDAPGLAVLIVQDNGKGFDLDEVAGRGGHGLTNLRTRAESLGGSLQIGPAPQGGTQVRVNIPI